jgi:hypothetical protein
MVMSWQAGKMTLRSGFKGGASETPAHAATSNCWQRTHQDGFGRFHGDLVIGRVAVWEAQVKVYCLQVQEREDELQPPPRKRTRVTIAVQLRIAKPDMLGAGLSAQSMSGDKVAGDKRLR